MANIKISQLPSLSTLSGPDQFPVVSGGTTYNVTANVAQGYMSTYPGGTFTGAIFSATDRVEATAIVNGGANGVGNIGGASSYFGTLFVSNITITGNISAVNAGNLSVTGTATVPTPDSNSANTQVATTAFVASALATSLPTGIINMWYGTIANIPTGWLLCDGTNGTPDLRDRFIVGAGSAYAVGATGGSANATLPTHTHTFTGTALGTHNHSTTFNQTSKGNNATPYMLSNPFIGENLNGSVALDTTSVSAGTPSGTNSTEGSSATNANLPPYYALAYIMKA